MSEKYKRQTDLFDPAQYHERVAIVGLGNIGSHTAMCLARMGISRFELWDADTVEEHNVASQAYTHADIGVLKADALKAHMLEVHPDANIHVHTEMYAGQMMSCPLLISGVDSMEVRRNIAQGIMERGYMPTIIDGRSGGGQIEVHTGNVPQWLENMPEVADTDPCGARFIAYASQIIGGIIASIVRAHIQGRELRADAKGIQCVIMHTDTMEILRT